MNPFVAEIQAVGFNFAPKGWALCAGQLMPISQNTALFSLLGTFYGGDGKATFGLPNLLDSVAVHTTQFSGGGQFDIGQPGGSETVTLLTSEMPQHNHVLQGSNGLARLTAPSPTEGVGQTNGNILYSNVATNLSQMNASATSVYGNSQPHNNMMPFQAITWIIALQGVYPPRT